MSCTPISIPTGGDHADDSSDHAEVQICDPMTGFPAPGAFVTLAGSKHPKFRTWARMHAIKLQGELERHGCIDDSNFAAIEDEQTDFLVACTLSGRGLRYDACELEYSEAAARRLYTDPRRAWFRHQLEVATGRYALSIRVALAVRIFHQPTTGIQ